MKNTNSNTILPKDNGNKIVKNRKSFCLFFHKSNLNMTYDFTNKNDKREKTPKNSVSLSSPIYISM